MLEIIAIIFLSKKNAALAIKKGLNPKIWRIYTVLAWIITEIIGLILAAELIGLNFKKDLISVLIIGITCAFGGYLIVRFILEKKPDSNSLDEGNIIEIDDLRPMK